jgi:hypothetical protein
MTTPTITFRTNVLKRALAMVPKGTAHQITLSDKKFTNVKLTQDNKKVLEFLLDTMPLTSNQSEKLSAWLFGSDAKFADLETSSVNDFFIKISLVNKSQDPVLEVRLTNKWYPIMCTVEKFKSWMGNWLLALELHGQIGAINYSRRILFGEWDFNSTDGKPVKKKISDLLKKHDLRVASAESIKKAKEQNARLLEFSNYTNHVYDAWGTGLIFHDFWGWVDVNVGWKDSPSTVIVEPFLENKYADREMIEDHTWYLPFVRVFSLKHKNYVYVDMENMQKHIFHRDGKSKIVLPHSMMNALDSIFNSSTDNIFGDLFHGRHGGIVVLANGPSGVGKTLTAEVFAEFQERPLYTMEMGEIGTNVQQVEHNLQKIFARAKKWNAVLLFDEADIFLSERVASDLERSAIVGIFLRLLDYYEGTFFLTTNRGEGIDKAFKSRVTLYLDYPDLTPETRLSIWKNMLAAAGLDVCESPEYTWEDLANTKINGRQIRNQVRLLKLMHRTGTISTHDIMNAMKFTAP